MVDAFKEAAEQAKKDGRIADYDIENGDGSVNQQVSQMNGLILRHVDAIAINAASPTALNGVIEKACAAGIKVVAFDSIANSPCCYKLDFDFKKAHVDSTKYIVGQLLGGKGNVLIVRGVKGSAPDQEMYAGQMEALKEYPNAKVVGEVYGQATTAVAQSAVSNILPSLPQVDAVLTQGGGDDYGVVQAFAQAGKKVPIVEGCGSSNFLKWWGEQYKKDGYKTISDSSAPGIGGAVVWLTLDILNGANPSKNLLMPYAVVTADNLAQYTDLPPGMIVSPKYTEDWVKQNLLTTPKHSSSWPSRGPIVALGTR
ncbi:MAG: ABC transporter substrate-binding protein, partial [Verrucomicrobia bacterium]|nr:ABC transporter substrate-binding protein [Verrucomicrobiota bacterium]